MAIAISPFRAFLNFLPLPIVLLHLLTVPELANLVPASAVQALAESISLPLDVAAVTAATKEPAPKDLSTEQKDALKTVFGALMSASPDAYGAAVDALVERYTAGKSIAPSESNLVELALLLNDQYPRDVGVLCVFLLNVIDCEVGDAIFLGANVPHAYISGDIIECMATSDNVVRAGLTPKLRDVSTLTSMLTYEAGPAERQFQSAVEFNRDPSTLLYDPPIDEFSVLRVHLAKDEVTTHRAIDGPSIAIVTAGEAIISWATESQLQIAKELIVTRGDVVFLAAGREYKWHARQNTEVFRAYVEA
jgi:mannose-6-phosphate isomerase